MPHPRVGPPLPGVVAVDLDGRVTVYCPQANDVLILNETASAVWRLLDGNRSSEEIVESLAHDYGLPSPAIAADVESTVDFFVTNGLIASPVAT